MPTRSRLAELSSSEKNRKAAQNGQSTLQVIVRREWRSAGAESFLRSGEWQYRDNPFKIYESTSEAQITNLLIAVAHELSIRPLIYSEIPTSTHIITRVYSDTNIPIDQINLRISEETIAEKKGKGELGMFLYAHYRPIVLGLVS